MYIRNCRKALMIVLIAAVATGVLYAASQQEDPAGTSAAIMVKNAAGKMVEKPQYGGQLVAIQANNPQGFEGAYSTSSNMYTAHVTNESLFEGDWSKGSQGTGEAEFHIRGTLFLDFERPSVATGWERTDTNTFVFTIRKGIYWHDKAPVNGRELTAKDVVWTIERTMAVESHHLNPNVTSHIQSVEATDDWTVVLTCVEGYAVTVFYNVFDNLVIIPPELGEQGLKNWEDVVGTGPYMLEEFVEGSSITLTKNPNYWDKDPLHPENTLPYMDGVKYLIMQDVATQLAAMRTRQADWLSDIQWEDAEDLKKSNPDMGWFRKARAANTAILFFRLDKPELPFSDIRVRRALAMATDQPSIVNDFYGGNAELFTVPVAPYGEFMDLFVPLEDYPVSVQEQYQYLPAKAEQLLDEAGYPRGADGIRFKTQVMTSSHQWRVDLLAIVASQWAEIGVDLTVDVQENAVARSATRGGTYPEMCIQYISTVAPYLFLQYQNPETYPANFSQIDCPECDELAVELKKNDLFGIEKQNELLKGIYPWIMEQAWSIELPADYISFAWQPWVKGYGGEWTVGYSEPMSFVKYPWIDQDLKAELTN